ncbi:MAG: hypothetical protein R2744_08935 [Bacteroidales bacterium]
MEVKAKEKYMRDLGDKDREMFSYLDGNLQKNETLQYIRNNLKKLRNLTDSQSHKAWLNR